MDPKTAHRIDEIAQALDAEVQGDGSLFVTSAAEPAEARADQLALALSPAYVASLSQGEALTAVLLPGTDWQALGLKAAIYPPKGRLGMAKLTRYFVGAPEFQGIHPTALVAETATVQEGVSIGAFSVIGAGAMIGAGTRIGAHVTVGAGVSIGATGQVGDGVRLCTGVTIGARVILHPNVVIGADGFSFVMTETSSVEQAKSHMGAAAIIPPKDATQHKIHSLGGVSIGDDVEIGANSTVDAGTIRATRIGSGTKIDNLVQIGHNVVVGRDCLLSAQAAVAGSTVIGDRTVLAGKSGVADNVTIGADCVITGAAIVLSNVPSGRVMMGYPATKMDIQLASYKAFRRLPRFLARLGK